MNLRDIQAFLAVVETGSVSAASARLNLTQPGVTRRVQNLEQRLGVALLDRQSKPVKPTEAGRQAYGLAQRVVDAVAELAAGLGPDGEPVGELHMGITPHLSDLALLPALEKMRAACPKLTLQVASSWSPALIEQVQRGALDLAAVMRWSQAPRDPSLAWHRAGSERVLLVGARDAAWPRRLSLKRVSAHPFVLNQHGCGLREELRHTLEAARLPFHIAIEAAGADLQLSLIAQGMGLGLVTESTLRNSPHRAALQTLDVPAFQHGVEAWLVHRPNARRLAAPIAVLRETLADALAPASKRSRRKLR